MDEDWVKVARETTSDLKVLMKGLVDKSQKDKVGVVSLVYVSEDGKKVEELHHKLARENSEAFYMIYAVNRDTQLDLRAHYPSIVSKIGEPETDQRSSPLQWVFLC